MKVSRGESMGISNSVSRESGGNNGNSHGNFRKVGFGKKLLTAGAAILALSTLASCDSSERNSAPQEEICAYNPKIPASDPNCILETDWQEEQEAARKLAFGVAEWTLANIKKPTTEFDSETGTYVVFDTADDGNNAAFLKKADMQTWELSFLSGTTAGSDDPENSLIMAFFYLPMSEFKIQFKNDLVYFDGISKLLDSLKCAKVEFGLISDDKNGRERYVIFWDDGDYSGYEVIDGENRDVDVAAISRIEQDARENFGIEPAYMPACRIDRSKL